MDDTHLTSMDGGWRNVMRDWGPRAIFESLLIVLSIILALSLSAWAGDMRTQARVREAQSYFAQEIRANRDILQSDDILVHHRQLHAVLARIDTSRDVSPADAEEALNAIYRTGIHVAPVREVVWRTYSSSEVMEHLPRQQAFALNDAYQAQEQIAALQTAYYPVLAALPAQAATQADLRGPIISLQLHLGDVIGSEENAVNRYDAALAALGQH